MKLIKRKIKYLLFRVLGKYNYLKKGIKCKHIWYGNHYGGFYINPDLVNTESIVYSFGIGEDISFDLDLINKHKCHVFGFDPTPKSINWIKTQKLPNNFKFYEYGIGNTDEFVNFYLPKNKNHVSGSIVEHNNIDKYSVINVELKSLKTILNKLGHDHIDILKMDIEGAEYDVLDNILSNEISITQILVEFHERFIENGSERTVSIVNKLHKHGYEIFGISDTFEEISFIHKNMLQQK
ncbi:MAG: FkbM family methyltransferase [Flavobacteriaceae bacterium]|nr:FkbM family methyltransferase [Flavobacteriaceae bacterium]